MWGQGLAELFNLMNFDGLWLDMNEPTTFCNGSYPICNSISKSE
ncbi:MAG: TIM-barrel domain-containing protein [bacterium]